MAEDLLDRIRREIGERLAAARTAYEESVRLEAALAALESERRSASPTRRAPARRTARKRPATRRAPRGENRRRLLEAVDQHPDASTRQVADATGIARATVATTLAKLVRDGELERSGGRGAGVRYRRAEPPSGPAGATTVEPANNAAGATTTSGD